MEEDNIKLNIQDSGYGGQKILVDLLANLQSQIGLTDTKAGFLFVLEGGYMTFFFSWFFANREVFLLPNRMLFIIQIVTIAISFLFSALTIYPRRTKGKRAKNIFFWHTISRLGVKDFSKHIGQISPREMREEIANQCVQVSRILTVKNFYLRLSIVFGLLSSLVLSLNLLADVVFS